MANRFKIQPAPEKDYYFFKIHGVEKKWERSELRNLIEKIDNKI